MLVRFSGQRGRAGFLGGNGCLVDARASTRSRWSSQTDRLRVSRPRGLGRAARVLGMGASVHALFLRLPCLLGRTAVAGQGSARRVRQRCRVARVAASARRARTTRTAPFAATGRSCLPFGAREDAPVAATPRTDRDTADTSALAPRARASQVGTAAAKPGTSRHGRSGATARSAFRTRESTPGLPADRGRAAQARPTRLAEHGEAHAACPPVFGQHPGAQD